MSRTMESDQCYKALLQIASRGDAIIAEILRLQDYIPPVYELNNKEDEQKYGKIILDYSYFNDPTEYEKIINTNPELQDRDEELKENNLEVINQFFFLFKNVYKYIQDLNNYLDEVEKRVYIQHTIETIFQTIEGKELLCESLYLYGVILLFVDNYINGIIRERLLVAYHRYNAQEYSSENPIDDICKLLRSTRPNSDKHVSLYIEKYFKRVPVNQNLVNLVIDRLISDDIYNHLPLYPNPEHKSTALANQAAMLYVCLFFQPLTLHNEHCIMRQIVDKYFEDNWIINVYMGVTVNIIDSWEPFKAAKKALSNTIDSKHITKLNILNNYGNNMCRMQELIQELNNIIGNTNIEEKILENINPVINLYRNSNVALRWYLLHTTTDHFLSEKTRKSLLVNDQVYKLSRFEIEKLFVLLITTSEFEIKIIDTIKKLLEKKEEMLLKQKDECIKRINELSELFYVLRINSQIKINENLQSWFVDIGKEIQTISMSDNITTIQKISQIIKALNEVKEFHQLDNNYPVSQTIEDVLLFLHQMIKIINIKDYIPINLQIIGNFSYAWHHIDRFTGIMQKTIKEDPTFVIKLRATFLKLVTCMEVPLIRINQSDKTNFMSVGNYYSNELIEYIRKVLQIIPKTMFEYVTEITKLKTEVFKEIPTRLEKDKLNEYEHFNVFLQISKLTSSASTLTDGVLCMKSTLVGIVEIDPKQLLEVGIRKELVKKIAFALHNGLKFNSNVKPSELLSKLDKLDHIMCGYHNSIEYIQDYIEINGLQIFQEELTRIIGYNIEVECNSFMRSKTLDWQSIFQSKVVPIPSFQPCDNESMTFIGRLAREIIRVTDPKVAVYKEQSSAWYDYKTNEEIINIQFYKNIITSIGICGLAGLDKLIGFMIVAEIMKLMDYLQKNVIKDREWLQILGTAKQIFSNENITTDPIKIYQKYCCKFQKILPIILESIMKIGQLQIIRKQIFFELETSCKLKASNLFDCLNTLNGAVSNEIKSCTDSVNNSNPNNVILLLELSKLLDWTGIGNPYSKIYIGPYNEPYHSTQFISLISFILTISQFSRLEYIENLELLMWKKIGDLVDGAPLYVGMQTFLKQFHSSVTLQYIEYLAQYFKSIINYCSKSMEKLEIPHEYQVTQMYVKRFMFIAELNEEIFEKMVPHFLTDTFKHVKDVSINQ